MRAAHQEDYAVAAECIRTSMTATFQGAQYLGLVEQLVEGRVKAARAKACRLNKHQVRGRRTLQSADTALLYALRPRHPDVWYLSPYEFTRYWDIIPTRVPVSRAEADDPTAHWDVAVQPCGYEKLCSSNERNVELVAGVDVVLARASHGRLVVFDDVPETSQLRHAWLLRRRLRPVCPHFGNCPTPRRQAEHREENARITAVYFRPWTMRSTVAEQHVPLATDVRNVGESWEDALRRWLDGGMLSDESRQHVGNFISVYRVRPSEPEDAANSDDAASDADVQLEASDVQDLFGQSAAGGVGEFAGDVQTSRRQDLFHSACDDANKTWGAADLATQATADLPCLEYDLDAARRDAKRSPKKGEARARVEASVAQRAEHVESMEATRVEAVVCRWLEDVSQRCNAEQHGFLKMVAQRVLQEEASTALHGEPIATDAEPLRWVLHGGPGAGKKTRVAAAEERTVRVCPWVAPRCRVRSGSPASDHGSRPGWRHHSPRFVAGSVHRRR